MAPGRYDKIFEIKLYHAIFASNIWWNYTYKGCLENPVNIGLGFGMVASGTKPKSEPVLTNIYPTDGLLVEWTWASDGQTDGLPEKIMPLALITLRPTIFSYACSWMKIFLF